jgi:hypothetical protein
MPKVCFEVEVHTLVSLLDGKPPKDGTTYKLQVRLKSDVSEDGRAQQLKYDAPYKGGSPAMKVEADGCDHDARLSFSFFKIELKSADTFLGSHDVPVTRGVDIVKRECVFDRPVDSVSISMTVTVRDITAAQEYRSGLPAANAANAPPPSGNKPGGDATFIPMLSIDDVLETNEAQVFEPYFPWLFASPPSRPTQATASRTSPKILLLNSTLPATTSKN